MTVPPQGLQLIIPGVLHQTRPLDVQCVSSWICRVELHTRSLCLCNLGSVLWHVLVIHNSIMSTCFIFAVSMPIVFGCFPLYPRPFFCLFCHQLFSLDPKVSWENCSCFHRARPCLLLFPLARALELCEEEEF